ncbi:MAG: alkaline shock response membrane anchor protein AmaP [Clostridia bacterium]|nr:alkaline shock response membrane anchor protein AmaP [Clostridia bacterium]
MTVFQKVVSVTLASVVLVVSIVLMLTLGGILEPTFGADMMSNIVEENFLSRLLFVLAIYLFIISLREIAFGEKIESEGKDGIILENESGKLIISKESLENLIAGVGKEIDGADAITSKTYIDLDKNVTVNVNVVVSREVVIKEISTELQKRIKAALKQTVDLDVKYVNIKIKNISNKKSKKNNEKSATVITEEKLLENSKENSDIKEE